MCRRSYSEEEDPRAKFYRQLQSIAKLILFFLALGIFMDRDFFDLARTIFYISAVFFAIKFVKIEGLPGTKGWLSDDWKAWTQERYGREKPPVDVKDKDLV
ncbi:MAG: hypothetical protein AAF433_12220 [Bacteroidota bacterium]